MSKAGEYIRLIDGELGADSLEFSASVSTYVTVRLEEFNHVTDQVSF